MGKMGIYIGRTSDTLETVAAGRNLLAAVQSAVMIHGIGKMISWFAMGERAGSWRAAGWTRSGRGSG